MIRRIQSFVIALIATTILVGCNFTSAIGLTKTGTPGSQSPTGGTSAGVVVGTNSGSTSGNSGDESLDGVPTPVTDPSALPLIDRYQRPDGQVNILILGSDFRPDAGYRTDVILLLSVNTIKNTASLISFPRDLYVDIPGWTMQRLNTAQQHGGFALTQKTFEKNFGVHPDHYVMTNFDGFRGIITALGGIDVQATDSLSDKCDLPKTASLKEVNGYCNVSPGTVHMDADTALWYSRARYSTDDFDRTRRAQEVVQAIFHKVISLEGLTKAPQLYEELKNNVETDMKLTDLLQFLPLATNMRDLNGLQKYRIDRKYVDGWITPGGADVQVPHTEDIFNQIIAKACYGQ